MGIENQNHGIIFELQRIGSTNDCSLLLFLLGDTNEAF
jgi:hypothetical protein